MEKGDLSLSSQPGQPWIGVLRCLSNLVKILAQAFSQSHTKAGAPMAMRLQWLTALAKAAPPRKSPVGSLILLPCNGSHLTSERTLLESLGFSQTRHCPKEGSLLWSLVSEEGERGERAERGGRKEGEGEREKRGGKRERERKREGNKKDVEGERREKRKGKSWGRRER